MWWSWERKVTLDTARNVYGVVIDPVTREVDYRATEELRRRLSFAELSR